MPCDSGMNFSNYDDGARRELDRVSRITCEILSALEAKGIDLSLSHEAGSWWQQHKAMDKARIEREHAAAEAERQRQAAIAKLTPEERRALGIRE